jgi:hypothetical protein
MLACVSTNPSTGLFELGETRWHETAFHNVVALARRDDAPIVAGRLVQPDGRNAPAGHDDRIVSQEMEFQVHNIEPAGSQAGLACRAVTSRFNIR